MIGLFDAFGPQIQGQQRARHHNDVIHRYRIGGTGKSGKPGRRVSRQHDSGEGVRQSLQYIADDHRVPQSNAQRPGQGQPAQDLSDLPQAPAFPALFIGPQGAGTGPAAHSKLRGQGHRAKESHKYQIGHQKGAAAVGPQLVGESPHIGHPHSRPHRGQNKPPVAGKMLRMLFHGCLLQLFLRSV